MLRLLLRKLLLVIVLSTAVDFIGHMCGVIWPEFGVAGFVAHTAYVVYGVLLWECAIKPISAWGKKNNV